MRPRNDENDGPFPKRVFPTSIFPRRIFPRMGGDDTEDDKPTAYESNLGKEDREKK